MKTISDFSCFADFRLYLLCEAERFDWPYRLEFKNVVIALSNPSQIGVIYNMCSSRERNAYDLAFTKLNEYGVSVYVSAVNVRYYN